jgi:glyoxylase-like metal-dependent hydrolase (beta-lactamase superfamily II)
LTVDNETSRLVVQRFESNAGAVIYKIPCQAFPNLWGNAYLVLLESPELGELRVLIDTGSGSAVSNRHLENGLQAVANLEGRPISLETLTHILITHGHIDHFGGLSNIRPRTQAKLGVHELDLRNLTHYEERIAIVARRLNEYLLEAGVSNERRAGLLSLYQSTKRLYHSVTVDFTYEAIGMRLGPFEMLHVPGHCAGHVVIRLHDVLFSGDHVLDQISPHQSPEHLTLSTGLDHYLKSLEVVESWAQGIRLTMGGHKAPIDDLPSRLEDIRRLHTERLSKVLDLLAQPHTILEVSHALFGELEGYNVLLAIEEAGAHIEYLYQRGCLEIHNLKDIEHSEQPIAIRYQSLPGASRAGIGTLPAGTKPQGRR